MKSMSKISQHKKIIVFSGLTIFVFLILSFIYFVYTPVDSHHKAYTIEIPKGSSFPQITHIIYRSGLIKNRPFFYILALSTNDARRIKAGEYDLTTSMSPLEILNKLVKGEIKSYRITILEDSTLREIAARLAYYKLVDENKFLNIASDHKFLASAGITGPTAEGFLFPDTYKFDRSMTTEDIIKKMVSRFRKEITPEMLNQAKKMKMTNLQFITLASIIGKETGDKDEKVMISAVFHNRLKKRMKLQSDPTAVYDIENFQGPITRNHLKRESHYNTYWIDGLPPGPIGNPGIDSLWAALNPAPVPYLYFVSNNNGTHQFSSSLIKHNEAVLRYQIEKEK
jgi:UPF0755 protein